MSEKESTVFGGRYELHRRLARGGMADVFVARDQLLGRPVAVKVLFPEFATDPKFVERFRREAQAAASLNHPNIVSIYDWGSEFGTYYIVMEYVEGQSLAQILRRDGKLTVEQVTRVALDVSAALGFAHDGGVVHRDVKPGNVLVSPKGEMKVADFGIATALHSNADANLTQTGAVMGTATYFSPEQAQGLKVDRRSDLYSLGVVMYEMLTGEPPFSGETPVSIAYKHVQEAVPPISEQGIDIPPALAAITMKLLSKNPDNRYPSAEALRSDLDRFRHGQVIAAQQVGAATPVTATAGRTGGAAAADHTTALPAQRHVAAPQRVPAAAYDAPPRRRGGLVFMGLLASLIILAGFVVLMQGTDLFNFNPDGADPAEPTAAPIQTVTIPSVGGRGEADARSTLEAMGLTVERRFTADDNVPNGSVIFTEPAANTQVSVNSTVTLVISSGANMAQVPSVVTRQQNDALATLQNAGFKVSINTVTSSAAPEGEVIAQAPQGNTLLAIGETVTIDVSVGIAEIPVPDVRGQTLDEARRLLEAEGFVIDPELISEFDEEIPKDSIVASDPPAGANVAEGDTLSLIISNGPEALFLPSWIGVDKGVAFIEMDELGLIPVEFGQFVTDPNMFGRVVDTIPAPNSFVEPGDQIQVYVGLPDPATGTLPVKPDNSVGNNNGADTGGQGDAPPSDNFDG